MPRPDESIDVVISNCVINLSVDKPAVFAEIHRLLRPGVRVGVNDVVTEDRLTDDERAERGSYVACIAGALSVADSAPAWNELGSPTSRSSSPTPSASESTPPSCGRTSQNEVFKDVDL